MVRVVDEVALNALDGWILHEDARGSVPTRSIGP